MNANDKEAQAADELRQRLAALLLTIPGWKENYTATLDSAGWLIKEAERLGWEITVK